VLTAEQSLKDLVWLTCKCGRGKASHYDGKCGHCRTRKERKIHSRLINQPPQQQVFRPNQPGFRAKIKGGE
jgi:hypothetical protein